MMMMMMMIIIIIKITVISIAPHLTDLGEHAALYKINNNGDGR